MRILEFQPIGEQIQVEPFEPEQTKGGIFLPKEAQEKTMMGLVKAVGEGYRPDVGNGEPFPLRVKVGDIILFALHSGAEYKDLFAESADGETKLFPNMLIMRERDILGIVKALLPESAVVIESKPDDSAAQRVLERLIKREEKEQAEVFPTPPFRVR